MPFANRTNQALLNSLFGKTSNFGALATRPTLYVALSSTTPAQDGTGFTEPVGGGYARVATAATDWNAATSAAPSVITNANTINFGTASGNWSSGANQTYFGLYDAASGGNLIGFGALQVPNPVLSGNPVSFAAGALSITND